MSVRAAHNTPIYLTADVRAIEAAAAAAPAPPQLMEKAGLAAAEIAREVSGGTGKPVLVLAGPGNNGGDAFVVARHLKQWYFNVTVVFAGDERRFPRMRKRRCGAWRDAGGSIVEALPKAQDWGLVVDGIFGIGLEREVTGRHAEWIEAANRLDAPVLALDVPSGLHSDTGRVMGCAVRANHTVTFIALKPGLLTLDGPDHCGEIHLRALELDAQTTAPCARIPDRTRSTGWRAAAARPQQPQGRLRQRRDHRRRPWHGRRSAARRAGGTEDGERASLRRAAGAGSAPRRPGPAGAHAAHGGRSSEARTSHLSRRRSRSRPDARCRFLPRHRRSSRRCRSCSTPTRSTLSPPAPGSPKRCGRARRPRCSRLIPRKPRGCWDRPRVMCKMIASGLRSDLQTFSIVWLY